MNASEQVYERVRIKYSSTEARPVPRAAGLGPGCLGHLAAVGIDNELLRRQPTVQCARSQYHRSATVTPLRPAARGGSSPKYWRGAGPSLPPFPPLISAVFTCNGALGTPSRTGRGPSLESIYRVSLTVDLCEGNKIISFNKFISPQPVGGPQKEKKSGALGTCPVCPLVKTALPLIPPPFSSPFHLSPLHLPSLISRPSFRSRPLKYS